MVMVEFAQAFFFWTSGHSYTPKHWQKRFMFIALGEFILTTELAHLERTYISQCRFLTWHSIVLPITDKLHLCNI